MDVWARVAVCSAVLAGAATAGTVKLWSIGESDDRNGEFALAPGRYADFKDDGCFLVGISDPQRDWPYVHPGPEDAWAGRRPHVFTVVFGLRKAPPAGECRLELDLLDTHSRTPPKIRIEVNGRAFAQALPAGAGDASVGGDVARGREHRFTVVFAADLLRPGDNEVRIANESGSWLLYDAVAMHAPEGAESAAVHSHTRIEQVLAPRVLRRGPAGEYQPLTVVLRHAGAEAKLTVKAADTAAVEVMAKPGKQELELALPVVGEPGTRTVRVERDGRTLAEQAVAVRPARRLTVHILPHSHTDIGYTDVQPAIEARQVQNLLDGMAAARRTAGYPEGSRFVWNVEVGWAADLFLRRLDAGQRQAFVDAVKAGQVAVDGMYLNELTGLCRPEELIRLFRFATKLGGLTGVPVETAMISDVPGYTWGLVPAMNEAGIRYFSTAPNYFDRIGTILREWENKPFWWTGPDGKSKVLVWIPFWGYALSHRYRTMSPQLVEDFCDGLEKRGYPYDIAYVRWSGHGDNAVPDPLICDFVRDWNARNAWPKFVISSTRAAFRALEERHGKDLPVVRGDWTPYWEDGAGSSARETAMNRASSERLAQAEALLAIKPRATYPAADFEDAWNAVLLYSEHTWGAWCSVSGPERKETKEQWAIKQGYAEEADRRSRELLERALQPAGSPAISGGKAEFDVFNTLSWNRGGLVRLPAAAAKGSRVLDDRGRAVPSQRLRNGDLVFLVEDMPPLAARRYRVGSGEAAVEGRATARANRLDSGVVRVEVDPRTGALASLSAAAVEGDFARGGKGLNDYLYLVGDNPADVLRNGPVKVSVGEPGPLVASLVIESEAPGCRKLTRELVAVAGADFVECRNLVDKARLPGPGYMDKSAKESVNFSFPFQVQDGEMWIDLPLGMMRPELDQMPGACKNWLTAGRWADVSNQTRGITWVTMDAPLVQVGGITATLLNSQKNPDVWRKRIEPTQWLVSWVMNNHWGTNYRAWQEGPVMFRFVLRPHGAPDLAEAARFATGLGHGLLAAPAAAPAPPPESLFTVEPSDVLVTGLKPSDDGKAWIIRLFGASGEDRQATIRWGARKPAAVYRSGTGEKVGAPAGEHIPVPGHGVVTLRAER